MILVIVATTTIGQINSGTLVSVKNRLFSTTVPVGTGTFQIKKSKKSNQCYEYKNGTSVSLATCDNSSANQVWTSFVNDLSTPRKLRVVLASNHKILLKINMDTCPASAFTAEVRSIDKIDEITDNREAKFVLLNL